MNREMFKSATLVTLFILCIVLTGQLMLSLSTDQKVGAKEALAATKTFDIKQFFSPQSYIISFGGGIYTQNYTVENSELWEDVQSELTSYLQNEDWVSSLVSISESRWVELVKSRAVRFRLPFYMTLSDVQSMLDLENLKIENDIVFNSILMSTHSTDTIYFGNEKDNVYYKMQGDPWTDKIMRMITSIENNTDVEYKRVEDLYGLGEALQDTSSQQNNSIIPINSMRVDFVKVTPEVDVNASDESTFKSYANKAFGKQFNFVKKMTDVDGSLIYLYGYANKALRIGADGSIEYTQRIEPGVKSDTIGLNEAVNLALNYVDQYGGAPKSLYLAKYTKSTDANENSSYILEFDYRIKELPIIAETSSNRHGVRVEIVGHQVVNFNRKIHRYKESFLLDVYNSRAFTINEVLERNSDIIQSDYEMALDEDLELSRDELWTRILGDITHVELAYFLESDRDYLQPVWKFEIGDNIYGFRLYDGKLLHSQKK